MLTAATAHFAGRLSPGARPRQPHGCDDRHDQEHIEPQAARVRLAQERMPNTFHGSGIVG